MEKTTLSIDHPCDFIEEIDLAIPNPNNLSLRDLGITSIEVYIGSNKFDEIRVSCDLETQIRTNCALLYKICHIDGITYIRSAYRLL